MKNFIALLLFAGGFGAWYLYHQKQETTDGLEQARVQLAEHEKVAAAKRVENQAVTAMMAIQKQVTDKKAELNALRTKLNTLKEDRAAVAKERQQALLGIRQSFVGTTVPLKLVSGRDLGQVRIMKVEDTGVSVATSLGVQKVPPTELPTELKQALGL